MSRHSPKEIERCKRIASKMTIASPAQGSLAAPSGYASRLEQLKAELNVRRLKECDDMLTDAGVPAWVMNSNANGVPSNTTVARLKYYLARRKNLAKWETDQKIQREMAEMLRYAQRHNAEVSHERGG